MDPDAVVAVARHPFTDRLEQEVVELDRVHRHGGEHESLQHGGGERGVARPTVVEQPPEHLS